MSKDARGAGPTRYDCVDSFVDAYLALALRVGRHIDGFVDAWSGEQSVRAEIDAEPLVEPQRLAQTAARLLDDVAVVSEPTRQAFLRGQLTALRCTALVLAGRRISVHEEILRYYGVEIAAGDTEEYATVHGQISDLLGGRGALGPRLSAFHRRNAIPADALLQCVHAVSEALRPMVSARLELPAEERVTYHGVKDVSWNAMNRYRGGFHSEISINVNAGRNFAALPIIVAHEAYGGHHVERCIKESELVHRQGQREHLVALTNTPQSLMSEGIGEVAVDVVLGPGWGAWTQDVLAAEGIRIDGPAIERMLSLYRKLLPARVDAMLMVHEEGASASEVTGYLDRWLLLPEDSSAQMTDFLLDPLWRTYSVTYIEGTRRVANWLAAQTPGGEISTHSTAAFGRLHRAASLPRSDSHGSVNRA